MIDPVTLVALLGPLVKSGGQALINKFAKGEQFKPANVDDAIRVMEAETNALLARSKVGDTDAPSYPWVAAAVKLQRPLIVYITIISFLSMSIFGLGDETTRDNVAVMTATIVFWLFGERTLLKIK